MPMYFHPEENMNRLIGLFAAMVIACLNMFCTPVMATEMTFQLVNDSEHALNFKLFSRGESRQ